MTSQDGLLDVEEVDHFFDFVEVTENQRIRIGMVREETKRLAMVYVATAPRSADRTVALRKLREALHEAVNAIARETT